MLKIPEKFLKNYMVTGAAIGVVLTIVFLMYDFYNKRKTLSDSGESSDLSEMLSDIDIKKYAIVWVVSSVVSGASIYATYNYLPNKVVSSSAVPTVPTVPIESSTTSPVTVTPSIDLKDVKIPSPNSNVTAAAVSAIENEMSNAIDVSQSVLTESNLQGGNPFDRYS